MSTRAVGPFHVFPVGLGCMNLSHAYGAPPSEEDAGRLLLAALDAGVTMFDTAALYGFGANETLVGRVLQPHRDRIVLCSKGGTAGVAYPEGMRRVIDGRPEFIRRNCEDSLRRLRTDVIDLYYLHRWDKKLPVEESIGAISRLVEAGKVRAIGMSEVSASTLRKAHAVHPIVAVQTEYSLWTRNAEIAVLDACREIGAAFVAFSPLARGLLTAEPPDPSTFGPKDVRRTMPRFDPPHWPHNLALQPRLAALAAEAGCTPAQLALAWLLAKAPHVVPIPGTTQVRHLLDNVGAAAARPPADLLARLDDAINERTVSGPRYPPAQVVEVDTETLDPPPA